MSTLLEQDEANRRRALELDSFIVEAPAGAGKTELLTQRYLRLLATVDEPEEIVAITFTNKAAGEMRERIAASLERARRGEAPPEPHRRVTFGLATAALQRAAERDWQLETQPGRLRLTTIDSLCASLARQMPYLSRFGAQPAVAEEAGRHYREAARRTIDHLEEEGPLGDAVALALSHLDNDTERLVDLLARMLARREQWSEIAGLDHPESAIADALRDLVAEELAGIAAALDSGLQSRLMPLARHAAARLGGGPLADWAAPLAADPADLPRWRALADFLLTGDGEVRRPRGLNKNHGFPPEDKAQKAAMGELLEGLDEARAAALRRLRELPAPAGEDEAVVRALVRLLKLAAAELWLVFRERGEVDFGELASRAIAAFGDETAPSELALRLDYRIRHLLVDEFQDTSPLQIRLLERLTAGWSEGDGRTLFAVGDPMQSIYRFRKADVGLFLQAARRGIGAGAQTLRLVPLRLSRNNRSHPAVVDWINVRFPGVFPPADAALRGEIAYRPFVATRPAAGDDGVFIHPAFSEAEEVARVLDLIAAERAADPARRIAVLARAKGHLTPLVTAMRQRHPDWRFSAVEIEPLAERQAVQDLIALTRALHHRADRLHWLAVLRAPWCGLVLADLHALAGDDHRATVWSLMQDGSRVARLSADGRRRLGHVRAVLGEALAGQGRQSRRRWVEDAWRRLGGPRCVDARGMEDARAFLDRLDALDAAGRFDLDRLEEDMAGLFAAAEGGAEGWLQLMTIHKAKGLEFDSVILPGLHRATGGDDRPLLAWGEFPLAGGERLVAAPVNRRRGKGREEGPTAYDFLLRLERERGANEEARILYVAATRAVRRLHLLGVASRREDGGLSAPRGGSPLALLWPALEGAFAEAAAAPAAGHSAPPALTGDGGEDALAHFVPRLLRLPDPADPAAWHAPDFPAPAAVRDAPADALGAAVGTLVHAVLEQIASAPEDWSPARARAGEAAYGRWLASRGWAPDQARTGAARAAALLATTLDSEDGRWVLRRRERGGAELALSRVVADDMTSPSAGTVSTRVLDRSFVEDGVRWIIDWKTAFLGADATPETLAAHAERHRLQLERYADLFVAEGLPIRLGVFHVAHGVLVRLDYNPPVI